ncbi:MAG TPA: DUF3962 domain-containing protein [Ktedonobacteraceae bacterium]|nr:DUF3962 domain-containing protein [Ktedonobacteraceae bacterium]
MFHELRPLAFRMTPEAIAENQEFSAYPFWILNLPESLKISLRQAIARASNRPEEKVNIPIRALNKAARMLIPDLISIGSRVGQAKIQPWLYGYFDQETLREPASSEAIKQIVRSWIRTSLPKNIPPTTRSSLIQQATNDILRWDRKTINLTDWKLADNGTAKPYIENTPFNSFVLLPDLIAARLSKAEIIWGPHRLKFRRAPLTPGQSGIELISWPPLEYPERKYIWPFSVLLTLTLQTIPFQSFPELHCEVGIRRWAGPEITHLPGGAETCVYLLDRVPWIEGINYSNSFQVAPISWASIPASERKEGELPYHLTWDSELIQLLDDLHPKEAFPDPQLLKQNPSSFIQKESSFSGKSSAAIVFRNGILPAHGVGPGLMPRDRYIFAEGIAKILQPDLIFIPPLKRKEYAVGILPNPFFEKSKGKQPEPDEELEDKIVSLAGTEADRREALAQSIKHLSIEIRYQSDEVHQALRNAIQELLGYTATFDNEYTWVTPEITIKVRSQRLGPWGETLSIKPGSWETQYDRLREAINQRATTIASILTEVNGSVGVLIELDNFDKDDPKPALRIGFARKGYHTQFITPQPNTDDLREKEQHKLEKQLVQRARSAVRDLLRQLGVVGLPPLITPKKPRSKNGTLLSIPKSLHYLGFYLIKQSIASSTTHIAQTFPVIVHMASNSAGIQVMAPGFNNWLSYNEALIELIKRPNSSILKYAEIYQFLQDTLERCLSVFGDTLLFCDAENLRGSWKWLTNEKFTKKLPKELERYTQLRIVRLRTANHEIPEWYAQSEKDPYGSARGVFSIGDSEHVFASIQDKPPTAMNLSKDQSKVLQKKGDKEYDPRPNKTAWNPGIGEMAISCMNPDDALMCAVVATELRHHFASHFGSPTTLPLPLHLAALMKEYALPLAKPAKGIGSEQSDDDEQIL